MLKVALLSLMLFSNPGAADQEELMTRAKHAKVSSAVLADGAVQQSKQLVRTARQHVQNSSVALSHDGTVQALSEVGSDDEGEEGPSGRSSKHLVHRSSAVLSSDGNARVEVADYTEISGYKMCYPKATMRTKIETATTLPECESACTGDDDCRAINWYPSPRNKCYTCHCDAAYRDPDDSEMNKNPKVYEKGGTTVCGYTEMSGLQMCYPKATMRTKIGAATTLPACQSACNGDDDCQAINWYPSPRNKCFVCHGGANYRAPDESESFRNPMVYRKSNGL